MTTIIINKDLVLADTHVTVNKSSYSCNIANKLHPIYPPIKLEDGYTIRLMTGAGNTNTIDLFYSMVHRFYRSITSLDRLRLHYNTTIANLAKPDGTTHILVAESPDGDLAYWTSKQAGEEYRWETRTAMWGSGYAQVAECEIDEYGETNPLVLLGLSSTLDLATNSKYTLWRKGTDAIEYGELSSHPEIRDIVGDILLEHLTARES